MARRWLLTLLCGVFIQVHGVPLQMPALQGFKVPDPTPQSDPPPEDIFSTIERMNKASKRPLRHGDIAVKEGRSAIACTTRGCLWPKADNGLVSIPYTLDPKYTDTNKAVIVRAMAEYSGLTCIKFVPRTKEDSFLNIISDSGCYSEVGHSGGPLDVSLDMEGCLWHGVIQHELNHAAGFVHEQSRSDRDSYVKILWDNINPEYKDNFEKVETNNLGLPYEYGSVMHYGRYSFAKVNYKPTIQPIPNNDVLIGQRMGLSNLDVAKINKLYNCNLCSSVLSDDHGVFSSASNPSDYPNNYNCSWLIRVPNRQVLLTFNAFDVQSSASCSADYIRVFDGPNRDSPLLLDRSCGARQITPLVASTNIMLVEFVTDASITATGFKATYSTAECGGTFITPTGKVFSPGFDRGRKYPAFSNCSWTILAPVGYKVQLVFVNFSLEGTDPCKYDFLEIRDGLLPTSPLLGAPHCGTSAIQPLSSSNNALFLRLISDASTESSGFLATYSFVPV